jgi:NADH-quinone oxidoreductase subunit L
MTTIALLLFIGAMGKSAQLGLHTWLPDAMEGPTPVSALIHAATMVTAGVFMLARCSPILEYAPYALQIICLIGALTAFFAATVGTSQFDIKRVIAYSTCSQLGYMFFAIGVGAYGAAVFHLFTHAFFKALLFLGAGSVIHAMHHEQDMRYYGALRKSIPITFAVMMIGTLAITGVPLLSGFYSKDAILESAFMSHSEIGYVAYALGTIAATLTSFYSWRLILLTFFGTARWEQSEHIQHSLHDSHADHYHPHESPWVMLVPLILLSAGALFAGFFFHDYFIGEARGAFWGPAIKVVGEDVLDHIHHIPPFWKWLPTAGMVLGLLLALNSYIWNPGAPKAFTQMFRGLHQFFFNKWYFDELYNFLFVRPSIWLGKIFWKGDGKIIDGFGPDGVSAAVSSIARRSKAVQTGYVYHYAFAMLIGLVAALIWVWPQAARLVGG